MGVSDRASKISFIIAAFCILIYIAAIAFGAVRIIDNIGNRRDLADREFLDLADRAASSAVFMGFMSEAYQETIRDFIVNSQTLLAVVITGSNGEYAFERYPGSGIVWTENSPRFKIRAGFLGEPFNLPLRIEGQRNVNIRAVYSFIDNALFLEVLRSTLLAVLIALTIAFLTLVLEITLKKRVPQSTPASDTSMKGSEDEGIENSENVKDESSVFGEVSPERELSDNEFAADENEETNLPFADFGTDDEGDEIISFEEEFPFNEDLSGSDEDTDTDENIPEEIKEDEHPQGLFTPRGNVGWESYTLDRLASELHRCASFEQDLVFLVMEFSGPVSDANYRLFTDEAVSFFTMRDLIFENGEQGASVIIPSVDLEPGIIKAEEFRGRILTKLPELFEGRAGLRIGLSSRAGRLIEAERLMFEASTALEKTFSDPLSPVIAFKSDLEKYRTFIRNRDRT